MSLDALEFQQVKEAWLLRRFSPNFVFGYAVIYRYSIANIVELARVMAKQEPPYVIGGSGRRD